LRLVRTTGCATFAEFSSKTRRRCSEFAVALGRVEVAEDVHFVHGGDDHEEKVPAEQSESVLAIQFPAVQVGGHQQEHDSR
jgi:hypothetical protein